MKTRVQSVTFHHADDDSILISDKFYHHLLFLIDFGISRCSHDGLATLLVKFCAHMCEFLYGYDN